MDQFIDTLLPKVKDHLRITFNSNDENIKRYIRQGISNLNLWTGYAELVESPINEADVLAHELIYEYARYANDGGAKYFRADHLDKIIDLKIEVIKKRRLNAQSKKRSC